MDAFGHFYKRTITNETKKTAMIANLEVKQNGPTFCYIVGGKVHRNKQIDPKPADNTKRLFFYPTKIEGPEVSDWYILSEGRKIH